MISLATEADRTLYFDFLPINIGTISGFAAKFQLYTVPGQVYYNATRKLVLRGVDGLVFVADSQVDKMDENIESLNNMKENLEEYGYDIKDLPVVMQYNKRDLPNILPVEELEAKINVYGWKSFGASAVEGTGVFDTLKMVIKLVLDKARRTESSASKARPAAAAPQKAEARSETSGEFQGTPASPASTVTARAEADVEKSGIEPAPEPPETAQPVRQPAYDAEEETPEEDEQSGRVEYSTLREDDEEVLSRTDEGARPPGRIAGDAAHLEQAEIQPDEPAQPRPFPGTTSRLARRDRRITVSDFQPASKEDDASPLKSKLTEDEDKYESAEKQDLPSPTMAPSSRLVKRKRGFFKRLFGI
jgi:signal recognition particle receptor subunit beta